MIFGASRCADFPSIMDLIVKNIMMCVNTVVWG